MVKMDPKKDTYTLKKKMKKMMTKKEVKTKCWKMSNGVKKSLNLKDLNLLKNLKNLLKNCLSTWEKKLKNYTDSPKSHMNCPLTQQAPDV